MLVFKLAKTSKPFSEGEFLKEYMLETAGVLRAITNLKKSHRTVTRRVELIDEDLASKLNKKRSFWPWNS